MAILHNEILIDAPIEKIWTSLSAIEELERYDPTVRKSTALTEARWGEGAVRKVEMKDGKNWFEEAGDGIPGKVRVAGAANGQADDQKAIGCRHKEISIGVENLC